MIVASARGGFYAPGSPQAAADFHEPYLKALFGFIGIDNRGVSTLRAGAAAFARLASSAAG